ncbi:DMT family transporter [Caldimonas thermodepolymerans]|uniref:Drug/metabolite transporter (DMT)-like permease n=1 Tax=Caldimonas thermodepolymerans TaxID=215580 RepID=A0A2S5T2P9_9BURK|nr:DMT family transporter [Caldimonas thermodepolymerans]PPE69253.1 EamA family transporter [Caldimonas thermodepolymerans]QPC32842.1 DMT family transporter [Caldimonas thermodepolymerans]RDI03616.1 drug/metabolite transporter (DMT)-like permease [Caldimonas thermodepolymerans]TCP09585.1 drug/metabolite transporter (DMT)-like permease [Caldimonas thermodepolymerans]UZG45710.1 DMT family transporter [Caldimonas thermodepolymerans]
MLTRRQFWGLALLTLMWGTNWPMMKFSLREITPLYLRATTMSGGALMLLAFYLARGVPVRVRGRELATVAWLALPNILGWHLFSVLGVRELASGRAAILGFTMPIWTVLAGALLFRERMDARVWLSVACGAAAVALLVAEELNALMGRPVGVVYMQVAAVSWALGTLLMRRTRTELPTEALTVWMMLLGSVVFWTLAALTEPAPHWHFSAPMWASLAWGAAINYGFAQIIWFGMARDLPPAASAFSVMAVPLVGTLAATVIVGEVPQWQDWAAALLIMGAIASALLPRR